LKIGEHSEVSSGIFRIKQNEFYVALALRPRLVIGSAFSAVIVFIAIGLIHRDLSERRQSEERLAKERAFLDLAIASLPGTFCLFNRDGKLLRWNFNLETISGYSTEEIAQMKPLDFFVEEYKSTARNAIQRVFKEGASDIDAEVLSKSEPLRISGLTIS
jgi:PAS domain-containing protein